MAVGLIKPNPLHLANVALVETAESQEQLLRKVADVKTATEQKRTFNVGGEIFATSMHNLLKERGSLLAALVDAPFGRAERPYSIGGTPYDMNVGSNFIIDRDGRLFGHVLEWLRTDK